MASLTTVRRISGIALIVGWAATLAVGIGTLGAQNARTVAKGVAAEIPIGGLSLAATVAYAGARALCALSAYRGGRGSDEELADVTAWAVELGQDMADAHPRVPSPRSANRAPTSPFA
jgi:hypothetical protein